MPDEDGLEPGADARDEPAGYQRGEVSNIDWKVAFGRCAAALAARVHEIKRLRHENAELQKELQRANERNALLERLQRR